MQFQIGIILFKVKKCIERPAWLLCPLVQDVLFNFNTDYWLSFEFMAQHNYL